MTFPMSTSLIQAIRVHHYGGPEQLKLEQIARPDPQTDEVLVRVYAAGGAPTAWQGLLEYGSLQPGQQVLIRGAAGGVGSFAVQFARWKGAHVIGTTSPANRDFVRSLGAETVIDYTSTPLEQVVHDIDLVLDTVGGETHERPWNVLKRGGTLVSITGPLSQEKAQELGVRGVAFSNRPSAQLLQSLAR